MLNFISIILLTLSLNLLASKYTCTDFKKHSSDLNSSNRIRYDHTINDVKFNPRNDMLEFDVSGFSNELDFSDISISFKAFDLNTGNLVVNENMRGKTQYHGSQRVGFVKKLKHFGNKIELDYNGLRLNKISSFCLFLEFKIKGKDENNSPQSFVLDCTDARCQEYKEDRYAVRRVEYRKRHEDMREEYRRRREDRRRAHNYDYEYQKYKISHY
jgi:hypothetical protein